MPEKDFIKQLNESKEQQYSSGNGSDCSGSGQMVNVSLNESNLI